MTSPRSKLRASSTPYWEKNRRIFQAGFRLIYSYISSETVATSYRGVTVFLKRK